MNDLEFYLKNIPIEDLQHAIDEAERIIFEAKQILKDYKEIKICRDLGDPKDWVWVNEYDIKNCHKNIDATLSQEMTDAGFVYKPLTEEMKNNPKYKLSKEICEKTQVIDLRDDSTPDNP